MLTTLLFLTMTPLASEQAQDHRLTEVLVIAAGPDAAQRQLRECISRQCPPDEEVAATVAYAESLFLAGRYDDAAASLRTGMDRNRRHARTHSVPVSEMARATGTIALHRGRPAEYLWHAGDAQGILRHGLPASDRRLLAIRLEMGDALAATRKISHADTQYREVLSVAERHGDSVSAAQARLRVAILHVNAATSDNASRRIAERELALLANSPDAQLHAFRFAARLWLAKLSARLGDERPLEQLISEHAAVPNDGGPILLKAPTIHPPRGFAHEGAWADIGFWIDDDGRPAEVTIFRTSKNDDHRWASQVVDAIGKRRYSQVAAGMDERRSIKMERFSVGVDRTIEPGGTQSLPTYVPIIVSSEITP